MLPITPRGFKDVLPEEARIREDLRKRTIASMDLWGYDPIETPTLEIVDVLEEGSSLGKSTFRLFDADNNLLVLRPDVTLPIARMVASRMGDDAGTLRFRYDLRVFRDNEPAKGQSREFTQIGIEQIGLSGPAADAETIVVFVESLMACGLQGFKIDFCTVKILNGLLDACDESPAFNDSVKSAFHASNYVKLDEILEGSDLDGRLADCLRTLMRTHGGRETILSCREQMAPYVGKEAFDDLLATWDLIEACGLSEYVGIDFSLLCDFGYYTGLVMEAFAPGFGKPLGSGGRYDNLLGVFGANMPAAGFAFSLERVMHALSVQGNLPLPVESIEVLDGCGAEDFKKARELHARGIATRMGGEERD